MKTQLNSLNRTANTTKISGEGNSHILKCLLTILLLLTLGVGEMWADVWIRGDMNNWENSDDWKFNDGKLEVSLEANTDYTFKVWDEVSYGNDHYRSYDLNGGKITGTIVKYNLDKDNVADYNLVLHTDEAGTYIFQYAYEDSKYKLSIYFPKARLQKQKYVYFDARRLTGSNSDYWQRGDFTARFWFKYYDSGSDNGSVDCNKDNALENWVYYALVPDNDYVGRIQLNRLNPSDHDKVWCIANIAYAKDRDSSAQNCLKEESDKENYCNDWTPQWTTYCPPMSSVTLADNGTTNWGGDGSSATPYLVPTGGDIKVHVTASASALDDANMTKYFLFKKEGSEVGEGSSSTEKTITASGTTGAKEAVTVDAYNYYNSTEGTHLTSSAIYYEARTPYTISYNAGTGGSGSLASETKLKGVNFTLPNSAVFERTGYTQTGWTTSNLGAQTHAFGASYSSDEAQTFYPAWTANEYIVTLNNLEATTAGTESVTATYDATLSAITKPTKTHYDFGGYWTSSNGGSTLTTQLIDESGNWKKSISDYTGASGDDPTWVHADNITLYAKWTEHEYTISIKVDGLGATEPASQIYAKYVTASADITATASTGYSFREWDFSKQGESDYDVWCADGGYTSTNATIRILAKRDGTLTANFTANNYTVRLDNREADPEHGGTASVNVTYDATTGLTSAITPPQKEHYTFGGYFTEVGGAGTQLINADGAWIAGVSGYTSASKQWIYAGDITLYAKWTENLYSVTVTAGANGSVSPSSVSNIGYVTASGDITATANTGYHFVSWTLPANVPTANSYIATSNPIRIRATASGQTITANFAATNYTVTLDNREPTTSGTTSVTATYDATLSAITQPTKTHYDFRGYWTDNNDSGATLVVQLIDENGNWKAGVSPYTGSDADGNPTWIYPNDISLFAKWEEHPYTIKLVVDPEGAGTIDKGATIEAYYVTASDDIRAEPNTGYSFTEWDFSKTDGVNDVYSADGYTSNLNPIRVLAQHDGTLTAKFTANNYNVNLENLGADEGYKGTENVSVTYNSSANLTENITIPQKEHYDFGGYYASSDEGVTLDVRLIDENGAWIADVSDYTGASGDDPTWIYAGDIKLYAKWTETMYPVAIAILPAGAGNVQVSGETVTEVTAGYATHSPEMTAVPANAAWVFKEWQVSSASLSMDLEHYSTTGTTMKITATADAQTLIAVFEPRYGLIGSLNEEGDPAGGMPNKNGETWGTERSADYEADFEVVGFTALGTGDGTGVDLQCTRPLLANKQYKFQVVDRSTIGRDRFCLEENGSAVLEEGNSVTLTYKEKGNANVLINTVGEGNYTFKITNISNDGNYYPTLIVIRPQQVNFGQKYQDVDGVLHEGTIGGSVAVAKTAGGALSSGDWVTYNTSVTHTATATSPGYTFAGWWGSDAFTGDSYSTTNPMTYAVIERDNAYAQFIEIPTSVTLSNDGHGHVEINDETVSSTTVGITTHRELTAVPDEGYKFDSWTKISGDDITLSSTSENPTTLRGNGSGATSGQEVRANFVERWALSAQSEGWGSAEFNIANVSIVDGKAIGYVDIVLPANTDMQFKMVDKLTDDNYMNGSDQVYYMTNGNSHNWSFATDKRYNCGITTAGAGVYRFTWNITDKKMTVTYPNFIIYRTGDKDGDKRATENDVESYDGGTISEAIEFRMRVNRLDKWYTLCLPFEVNAVKVWDEEDGQYYDIVPYWRTNGTYYTGHYILRRPVKTTDFAIEGFEGKDRWVDPESSNVLPSKNIPYIIQWHDGYFSGKYISFFGSTNQTIHADFNAGEAPSADDVVNVFGNNTMHIGTVKDAYLLDKDYGPSGAWLREDIGTDRTILPFECFIRANDATTTRYRILRRGMEDDTPTGLDTLSLTEDSVSKVMINNRIYIIRGGKIYTIQGTFVKEVE